MKRNKRIIAGMLGCILTAACIQGEFSVTDHALSVSQCVIDTTAEYQTIRGFGGINHPEWIGDLTESQRQTAFGNGDEELGLSILRVSSTITKRIGTKQFLLHWLHRNRGH